MLSNQARSTVSAGLSYPLSSFPMTVTWGISLFPCGSKYGPWPRVMNPALQVCTQPFSPGSVSHSCTNAFSGLELLDVQGLQVESSHVAKSFLAGDWLLGLYTSRGY